MAEPTPRRVLLCGGPMDGRWIVLPAREHTFRVVVPSKVHAASLDPDNLSVMPETVDYQVVEIPQPFRRIAPPILVGLPSTLYGRDRESAIIRAVFQRDVAQLMLEGR